MAQAAQRRVTVVDDDALVLAIIDDELAAAGFKITSFRTAEESLADIWDQGTDLIITDVLLPRMSGLDLVREVRCRPWGAATPVIAMSALQWDAAQLSSLQQLLRPGCVLTKPLRKDELASTVLQLLSAQPAPAPASFRWPSRTMPMLRPSTAELMAAGKQRVEVKVALDTPRELVSEYTQNLMHDGLFVPSYHPLPVDTEVEVYLTLPFRSGLKVSGKVVLSIDMDSPEGITRGPGMAIAVYDLPKEVKRELKVYVAGVRAGSAAMLARADRAVVLAGLRALVPAGASSFLRRSAVQALHADDLPSALVAATQTRPSVVAIHNRLLTGEPRAALAAFHASGIRQVLIVAENVQDPALPRDLPMAQVVAADTHFLEMLAVRLDVVQRSAGRVPLNATLRASRPDSPVSGRIENLSLGGVLLATESPCAVGERLQMEFDLPLGTGTIRGVARTLRVGRRGASSEVLVAAVFERLDADSTEALRRFLEGQVGPEAYRYLGDSFS